MDTLVAPTPEAGSKPAQIMEAAATLFLENGYGAVSMDMVAKKANVSKATLYAHFGSKDELFRAMVARECKGLLIASICEEARQLDIAEGLRRIGHRFLSMILSPKALAGYRVVVGEAHRFPELARAFYEAGPSQTIAEVTNFMAGAAQRGVLDIPDPQIVAEQFLGILKSRTQMRYMLCLAERPTAAEEETTVNAAVDLIIRAYGVK